MTKFNRILAALLLWVAGGACFAQDIHYSQFFNNPMMLNPSLTGRYNEDWCFNAIHRNQWSTLNSTFQSSAFGFDMNFVEGIFGHDKLGAGAVFYHDELGESVFKNNSFLLSLAYHRTLDLHKRHHISIGVQGGYITKEIDYSSLYYNNQYGPSPWVLDRDLDHGEYDLDLKSANAAHYDLNVGVFYSYKINEGTSLNAGISSFQITTPKESFTDVINNNDENELGARMAFDIGVRHRLNSRFELLPRILIMQQSRARDILLGALVGTNLGKTRVHLGAYYRWADAAILMAGLKYKSVKMMFSYDMTTSSLADINEKAFQGVTGSGLVGAWEVSLRLCGVLSRAVPGDITIPCGIF